MELSSKLCDTLADDDRLIGLPDELLLRILSLLPTKDVAAVSILSRKLRRVFPLITTLDFDVSPISLCLTYPYAIERFPTFVTFVDNVLFAYKSLYLSKFRLRMSMNFDSKYYNGCESEDAPFECGCHQDCLPDLKFAHLHAWISFPLTLCGLREIDLCILVRDPGDGQLPTAIFMCETLEVLKLEVNLRLDQVSTMSSYCLPNLKLLHLCAFIPSDDFLPRLVLSCPSLEDLTFNTLTKQVRHATIHSPSLRRLCLHLNGYTGEVDNRETVNFCTPKLEYLEYGDNLALEYSIPIMHGLVEAKLYILDPIRLVPPQASFQNTLKLLECVSYVQRLTLEQHFHRELDRVEIKDQLPMFLNLNHLTLYRGLYYPWDKFLWEFLKCSPVLETLVFETGLSDYFLKEDQYYIEQLRSEREFFRTGHVIPSCCSYHLKRIVINEYLGSKREVAIIQFLLSHALVLEELVICRAQKDEDPRYPDAPNAIPSFPDSMPDQLSVENTLNNLPRASPTCSIQVS